MSDSKELEVKVPLTADDSNIDAEESKTPTTPIKAKAKAVPRVGRIYKIYHRDDPSVFYIGSTTDTLTKRLSCHKSHSKKYPSKKRRLFEYFRQHNYQNFSIVEVKQIPFTTMRALRYEEDVAIQQLKPALNKNRACLSDDEKEIYHKNYHQTHKNEYKQLFTKWYLANKSKYECEHCQFQTPQKANYSAHMGSPKHKNLFSQHMREMMMHLGDDLFR